MKISQSDREHLYLEIVSMDGRGLSDYLSDWTPDKTYDAEGEEMKLTITSTLYGEKTFICGEYYAYGSADIFNSWSEWKHLVNNYFDVFMDTQEKLINSFNDIDEIKEFFVFRVCKKLGIVDTLENYLKVVEPYPDKASNLTLLDLI